MLFFISILLVLLTVVVIYTIKTHSVSRKQSKMLKQRPKTWETDVRKMFKEE